MINTTPLAELTIDGKVVSVGFHPALQFHTNPDNSLSR